MANATHRADGGSGTISRCCSSDCASAPIGTPSTQPSGRSDGDPCRPAAALPLGRATARPGDGGWVENSVAMEGYFEDGDGWAKNALVKVL
ncbi:hypothetical protein [Streptomyces sp. b62]|uniref:hypothetical protein n=1 Tax=Streptomyces sp. b62 TaxID=1827627 RepID=UPI00359FEBAC